MPDSEASKDMSTVNGVWYKAKCRLGREGRSTEVLLREVPSTFALDSERQETSRRTVSVCKGYMISAKRWWIWACHVYGLKLLRKKRVTRVGQFNGNRAGEVCRVPRTGQIIACASRASQVACRWGRMPSMDGRRARGRPICVGGCDGGHAKPLTRGGAVGLGRRL